MPMEKLKNFVRRINVHIGIITVPYQDAQKVCDELVDAGIKAIWNFAHVDLNVPAGVQVENVHLSDSLMKLSYNISRYRQENSEDK